jgi:hypothetical protein
MKWNERLKWFRWGQLQKLLRGTFFRFRGSVLFRVTTRQSTVADFTLSRASQITRFDWLDGCRYCYPLG